MGRGKERNRLVDSIVYPSLVGGFFEILQNHASSVIVFYKGIANYLNKIFTRKNNMKIRKTDITPSNCSLILNFSWMWLALQFSFHRLFSRGDFSNCFGWQLIIANVPLLVHVHRRYGNLCPNLRRQEQADHKSRLPDYWR